MKIWILSSELPTYNPGGIARYIDNFARALGQCGHAVTVIARGEADATEEVAPGFRLISFRARWDAPGEPPSPRPDEHPRFPFNLFDYWTALAWQFAEVVGALAAREGGPDVLETQEYGAIGYYVQQRQLTEADYLPGVPIVVNAHSPDFLMRELNEEPVYQFPQYWNGQMEKACLWAADAVIAPSQYLADQLENLFEGLEVRAIPLPWTDVSHLDFAAAVEPDRVLFLGRLEVRKGVLRLLAEVEALWQRGATFTLALLGGDCAYAPRGTTVGEFIRHRYAHRLEDGHLELLGARPHDEVLAEIQRAAVVTIPSIWENWPNTCIEAMSLGKVVVASEHGGQAEMIGRDGRAGFLFSWEREGQCGQQLARALCLGEAGARSMGAEARRRIAALCAPSEVLPRRLEHFERIIAGRGPRTRFPFVNRHLRRAPHPLPVPAVESVSGLVSVVVPCFNMGAYVAETVASALASDYRPLEVVIVDDGSDDPPTLDRLAGLAAKFEEVRIVRQANAGLAAARNTGGRAARGEFLLLLDADDQVEPTYLSQAVRLLRQYQNVQIVFSWERYFEASDDIFPGWNLEFPYLLAHNQTCPVCVVDRAAWLAYGQNPTHFAYNFEDYASWIRMVANGCGGVCLHQPLTRYRIRREGLWQGSSRTQHLFLYELLVREFPELYREYGPELFNLQNANGSAQVWLKPAARSPYDERVEWEDKVRERLRRRVLELEAELARAKGTPAR